MRKAGVSLGLCLGLAELAAAILMMQAVAQAVHPTSSVRNALMFALAFLTLPGLTIAGSLLGLRYGLAGGLLLLIGGVTLLAVFGVGPIICALTSTGWVAGALLILSTLRTLKAP